MILSTSFITSDLLKKQEYVAWTRIRLGARLGPGKTSIMERFCEKQNYPKAAIFAEIFIIDVWQGLNRTFEETNLFNLINKTFALLRSKSRHGK